MVCIQEHEHEGGRKEQAGRFKADREEWGGMEGR